MPYVVKRPERNLWEQSYVPETLRGMGITLRHFFRNDIPRVDDLEHGQNETFWMLFCILSEAVAAGD